MPLIASRAADSAFALGFGKGSTNVVGQALFNNVGSYTWTAPAGVTSICVVCVGGGGSGGSGAGATQPIGGGGGGGGGLGWRNNIAVIPGNTYSIFVGAGGAAIYNSGSSPAQGNDGQLSYFENTSYCVGYGGTGGKINWNNGNTSNASGGGYVGDGGGYGGNGGTGEGTALAGGGGGAGGYSGNGGQGGNGLYPDVVNAGSAGSGGGGGGGSSGTRCNNYPDPAAGGGGVSVYGQGTSGAATSTPISGTLPASVYGGKGGSGGNNASNRDYTTEGYYNVNNGGAAYGAGGAGTWLYSSGSGNNGAVRIIWGAGRAFPSTNTQDM